MYKKDKYKLVWRKSSKYANVLGFNEGLCPVGSIMGWGYIDTTNTLVCDYLYEEARVFYENLAIVKKNGKYGVINKRFEQVVDYKYDYISDFYNNMAIVCQNQKFGVIDNNGNKILACDYKGVLCISNDKFLVKDDNDGFLFISRKGKMISELINSSFVDLKFPSFDNLEKNGLIRISNFDETKNVIIDNNGQEVLPLSESLVNLFWDDYDNFIFLSGYNLFYIKGREVAIECETLYKNGLIPKKIDSKVYKVSTKKYKYVERKIVNGLIKVGSRNGYFGLINCVGKEIVPCECNDIYLDERCQYITIFYPDGRIVLMNFFNKIIKTIWSNDIRLNFFSNDDELIKFIINNNIINYDLFFKKDSNWIYDDAVVALIKEQINKELLKKIKATNIAVSNKVPKVIKNSKLTSIKENNSKVTENSTVITNNLTKSEISLLDLISKTKSKFIAQDKAIDMLSANIWANQKIIKTGDKDFIRNEKASILLDGSTGTGKTAIITEISQVLDIPIVVTPITNYTTTGYVGGSLSEILLKLLSFTEGDLKKAQNGIVCLDEFDKLAQTNDDHRGKVNKRDLQQELLSYISGMVIKVNYNNNMYEFDTSNLTFICMGAFTNLRETKKVKKNSIGFRYEYFLDEVNYSSESKILTKQDYVDYGLERELIGRLNVLVSTKTYTKEDYKQILLNSSISPLKAFIKFCNMFGINNVYVDDDFIDLLVAKSVELEEGVRGLQYLIGTVKNYLLKDIMLNNLKEIYLTTDLFKVSENYSRK